MNDKEFWNRVNLILTGNMPIHPEHEVDKRNIVNGIRYALSERDKSRDQQIALAARVDELKLITDEVGLFTKNRSKFVQQVYLKVSYLRSRIATLKEQQNKTNGARREW